MSLSQVNHEQQLQGRLTKGIHHLGLSVLDVSAAAAFFCEVLQFEIVGEKPDYPAIFVADGRIMLTLWQTESQPVMFDRRNNVGLHHFALEVPRAETLAVLHQRLQQHPDVQIEFPPEALGMSDKQHMMCLIPGGIRMELILLGD